MKATKGAEMGLEERARGPRPTGGTARTEDIQTVLYRYFLKNIYMVLCILQHLWILYPQGSWNHSSVNTGVGDNSSKTIQKIALINFQC
jgi:hypothetical protein